MRHRRRISESALGRKLLESTGASSVNYAIDSFVDTRLPLIDEHGRRSLAACARYLRVDDVDYEEIAGDGYVVPKPNGSYSVTVSLDVHKVRQRFTIAHELGHILLHDLEPSTRSIAHRTVFTPPGHYVEESLCDKIAASILCPRSTIHELWQGSRVTPSLIHQVADYFCVSKACAAIRLQDVYGLSFGFGMISVGEGEASFVRQYSRLGANNLCGSVAKLDRVAASRLQACWDTGLELSVMSWICSRFSKLRARLVCRAVHRSFSFECIATANTKIDPILVEGKTT